MSVWDTIFGVLLAIIIAKLLSSILNKIISNEKPEKQRRKYAPKMGISTIMVAAAAAKVAIGKIIRAQDGDRE